MLKHQITAAAAGFPQIELEFNVGATSAQYELALSQGAGASYLTDIPNWDAVAADIGAVDAEGAPLEKPTFPLTKEATNDLPMVLGGWIAGIAVMTAVHDYMENVVVPNSMKR